MPPFVLADCIYAAAQRGDLFTVRHYLAKEPASARATDGAGYTALHWEAIRGHGEAGSEVNATGGDGGTPLHWACHHDEVGTVRLLLDGGADPAIANRWGRTALHVAYLSGQGAVVELLVAAGASMTVKDGEGKSPAECERQRPADVPLDPSSFDEYAGRDALGPGAVIKVWREGESLRLVKFAPDEIYPTGPDRFHCRQEP